MSSAPTVWAPPSRRGVLGGLIGLVGVAAGGCTRFALRRPEVVTWDGPALEGPRAGVSLATFFDDGARGEDDVYPYEVHTELWLLGAEGARELVHRGRDPTWVRDDLVPGRYEVVLVDVADDTRVLSVDGARTRRFTVREGERAELTLTLRSVPWEALLVVAVVVVVVVVIVAVVLAQGGGGGSGGGSGGHLGGGGHGGAHLPAAGGGPRGGPGLPPAPYAPHVGVYAPYWPVRILFLPCDVYVGDPDWRVDYAAELPPPPPPPRGPGLAAILPPRGDRRGAVVVRFTSPMRPEDLGPDTLLLVGPDGPVSTGVAVVSDGLSASIRPLHPLTPGRWVVRVLGRALHDAAGATLGYDAQVAFTVA